jgi:capsid protein
MEMTDTVRLRTRLFAIEMRLQELEAETQRTQLRVRQLEAELGDARLAGLVGGESRTALEISPELEQLQGHLERQQAVLAEVTHNRWKARVAYTVSQAKERMRLQASQAEEAPAGDAA